MVRRGIVLIGLPGAGKTSIGRYLSKVLNLPFTDTDDILSVRRGISITEWFAKFGEDDFRSAELELIRELAAEPRAGIIATGGGTPCIEGASHSLRQLGMVVFLDASVEIILQRIQDLSQRPLLQTISSPEQILQDLYKKRFLCYRNTAHHILEIKTSEPLNVVSEKLISLLSAAL